MGENWYWLFISGYFIAGIMTARIGSRTVWRPHSLFGDEFRSGGWVPVFLFWPFLVVAGFFYLIGRGLYRVVIPRDDEPLFFYKRKPKPVVQSLEEGYPDIIRKQA